MSSGLWPSWVVLTARSLTHGVYHTCHNSVAGSQRGIWQCTSHTISSYERRVERGVQYGRQYSVVPMCYH